MRKLLVCILLMGCNPFVNSECSEVVELQKESITLLRERLELKDKRIDILKKTLKERDAQFSKLLTKHRVATKDEIMWVDTSSHFRPNQEGYYGVSEIGDSRGRVVQVIDPKLDGHFVVFDTEHTKKLQDIANYAWYGRIRFQGDIE
jgi:hypothetical protein